MKIGQVAKAAHVNVETVRYYQRRGLLTEPAKPVGRPRHYCVDDVNRLQFIKRAQAFGFSLDDVEILLSLDGVHCCADTRDLATRKLAEIDEKLAGLVAMRHTLAALIQQCGNDQDTSLCPIIRTLSEG